MIFQRISAAYYGILAHICLFPTYYCVFFVQFQVISIHFFSQNERNGPKITNKHNYVQLWLGAAGENFWIFGYFSKKIVWKEILCIENLYFYLMVGNPFYLVYVRKSRTFSCFELELELEQKPRTFRTRTSNSNAFDPTLIYTIYSQAHLYTYQAHLFCDFLPNNNLFSSIPEFK